MDNRAGGPEGNCEEQICQLEENPVNPKSFTHTYMSTFYLKLIFIVILRLTLITYIKFMLKGGAQFFPQSFRISSLRLLEGALLF